MCAVCRRTAQSTGAHPGRSSHAHPRLARAVRSIFVAYADCGTGGLLDKVLLEEGVERIPGAHCYEFFATAPVFADLAGRTRHLLPHGFFAAPFRSLGHARLGLDRHPELFSDYFGNYRKLVYLAQEPGAQSLQQRAASQRKWD